MIKNIVFDLGGVILPLEREAIINSFSQLGYPHFNELLDNSHQRGFFLQFERGEITSTQFRDKIREQIEPKMREKATDRAIDKAMGTFLLEIPLETLSLLERLKERYPLYLLSNINPIALSFTKNYFKADGKELEYYFKELYLSFELKMVKPELELFKRVVELSGVEPSHTLFIDDSPYNIEAAEQLKFKTLHFRRGSSLLKELEGLL